MRDERGVSEVIGFTFGFFMSFLLLMIAVYAFGIVEDQARENETRAAYKDIAGRVSTAVLGLADVGGKRVGSLTVAPSSDILVVQRMTVPVRVHDAQYRITLLASEVQIESLDGSVSDSAPNLNLQVTNPCTASATICEVSGSVVASSEGLSIMYEYKAAGASSIGCAASGPVNCIILS